jgi:protein-disulfide isomerase
LAAPFLLSLASAQTTGDPSSVVARIGETTITRAQLTEVSEPRLNRLRNDEYSLQKQVLNEQIEKLLLEQAAAAKGLSVGALLKTEVNDKVPYPSEVEALAVYDTSPERYTSVGQPTAVKQIQGSIWSRRVAQKRTSLLQGIRAAAKVEILLDPPRVKVPAMQLPSQGPEDASVNLIEISDFQCPYCFQAQQTLSQLKKNYGAKVRFSFLNLPLSMHKDAMNAAIAGHCAAGQGRFFEMHDRIFANRAALQLPDLKRYAGEIGLDPAAFDACLASNQAAEAVQKQAQIASQLGASSTPSFLINGRLISGAQPYAVFAQAIDEELARAQRQ